MRKLAIAISLLGLVACSKLFGDAVQCRTDGDCSAFAGSVCDTSQGVCTTPSDAPGTTPPPGNGTPDADTSDTSTGPLAADPCLATNKPQGILLGRDAGASSGADGGTTDIVTDTVLGCDKDWVLTGKVVVQPGATLTVQKGTTVKGDAATKGGLTILPGAKLIARGEKDAPIVFTSSAPQGQKAPGDWAGIVFTGKAGPAGQLPSGLPYGGDAADDSSGALRFVRVEYAGLGLVFGGVGTGTDLDFVQVRRPNDNCYVWYGGTVNAKHLVCQSPADEPFEYDQGYTGKMQFLLSQGTPPDTPGHNGFLVNASQPTVYNATVCGRDGANLGYGVLLRNGAHMHLANAIFTGWNAGVDVVGPAATPLELVSSVFFGNLTANIAFVEDPAVVDTASPLFDDDNAFDEIAWFQLPDSKNSTDDPGLTKCFAPTSPVFGPSAALKANAATPPTDGFFDVNATYVGALRDASDTWATGAWVVWAAN